jgi:hypothetical protein
MNNLKYCGGYKGEWYQECEKEYPDHWVPKEYFNVDRSNNSGLQGRCQKCHNILQGRNRPKHPTTGENKRDWKHRIAKSMGGIQNTPGWQDYLDKTEIQWGMEIETRTPRILVTPSISPEREFGPYLPMTSYKSTERIGMEVEDGDVYVVQNPLTPDIQKVGKTFPNGIAAILAAARRFGPAILIYKQWFPLAFEAEQAVHKILEPYNLRKLRGPNPETGLYDCGIELFECSIETVLKAIEEVSIDTKKK